MCQDTEKSFPICSFLAYQKDRIRFYKQCWPTLNCPLIDDSSETPPEKGDFKPCLQCKEGEYVDIEWGRLFLTIVELWSLCRPSKKRNFREAIFSLVASGARLAFAF